MSRDQIEYSSDAKEAALRRAALRARHKQITQQIIDGKDIDVDELIAVGRALCPPPLPSLLPPGPLTLFVPLCPVVASPSGGSGHEPQEAQSGRAKISSVPATAEALFTKARSDGSEEDDDGTADEAPTIEG